MGESRLRVEIVRDEAALAVLRPAWDELYTRAVLPRPHAAADWVLRCWARCRDLPGVRLHTITVYDGQVLVLLLPLLSLPGPLGLRVVQFIESLTPFYCDALVEDSPAGVAACREAAVALADDLGIFRLRFNAVENDAAVLGIFRWLRVGGSRSRTVRVIDLRPYAYLDAYLAQITVSLRQDFRRRNRQLRRMGDFDFGCSATPEEVRADLETMNGYKREKLEGRGERATVLFSPRSRALFEGAALDGLATGRCRVYRLKLDDRLIAAEQVFFEDGRMWMSKSGHDPSLNRYSVGTVLKMLIVGEAIAAGHSRIDLMFGDYDWKPRMANAEQDIRFYRGWGRLMSLGRLMRKEPAPLAEPVLRRKAVQPPA